MEKTIFGDSNLGKRLKNVQKEEERFIIHQGKKVPMVQKITIGRDSQNTIVLEDKLVSRKHAIIQKIKEGYFIMDLGSSNGTFINDEQIKDNKYHRIYQNDVIRLGRTALKIH